MALPAGMEEEQAKPVEQAEPAGKTDLPQKIRQAGRKGRLVPAKPEKAAARQQEAAAQEQKAAMQAQRAAMQVQEAAAQVQRLKAVRYIPAGADPALKHQEKHLEKHPEEYPEKCPERRDD